MFLLFLQALPIYLDKIFHPFVAVLLSVTFVLAFGEVKHIFFQSIMNYTQILKQVIVLTVSLKFELRLSHKQYAQDLGSTLVQILCG